MNETKTQRDPWATEWRIGLADTPGIELQELASGDLADLITDAWEELARRHQAMKDALGR